MCWLIVSLEMKTGWKEKSNRNTFFSTDYTGKYKLIMPEYHEETRISCNFFPLTLVWALCLGLLAWVAVSTLALGLWDPLSHSGFQDLQLCIFSNAFSRPRICPVPSIPESSMINHRHLIIRANVYSLLWAGQFTHIHLFHLHNNNVR